MCDCPFCPLVQDNVYVCDVVVTLDDKKQKFNITYSNTDANELLVAKHRGFFELYAKIARKSKTPRGSTYASGQNDCEAFAFCINKNKYRICFHTKKQEVVESKEVVESDDPC